MRIMRMNKLNVAVGLCGLAAMTCLNSCLSITDEINLDKEISLDMQIGSGGIAVPMGSLNRIYIDSLLKTDGDNSVLEVLDNGKYGISMDGEIDNVGISINDVTINIPNPEIDPISTNFDDATVDDVTIKKTTTETTLEIQSVDMSALNDNLPTFKSEFTTDEQKVSTIAGVDIPKLAIEVPEQTVECTFNYDLPEDVTSLNRVYFGPQGATAGQKLTLNVDLSSIYSLSNAPTVRITTLNIEFPKEFTLARDSEFDKYVDAKNVKVADNKFSVTMANGKYVTGVGDDKLLPVTFYVSQADFSNCGTEIEFAGDIKYDLKLEIGGKSSSSGDKAIKVNVDLGAKLEMNDFSVNTKSKTITMEPSDMKSQYEIDGLADISEVKYVEFDSQKSFLNIAISELDITPFTFDDESTIDLSFQGSMAFDRGDDIVYSEDGIAVGKWKTEHSLYLRPGLAMGKTIQLKVARLDVYQDVIDNSVTVNNNVQYSADINIAEAQNVNSTALDVLGDKKLKFDVSGKLIVTNASVVTSGFETLISDSTTISIDEEVDAALVDIKQIELVRPADFNFALKFNGVPASIDQMNFKKFTVEFPSFIDVDYVGTDKRITIEDSKLIVNGDLTPDELSDYGNGFQIEGMRIVGMSFDSSLVITEDNRIVLQDQEVKINGKVGVDNMSINSGELDNIIVTPVVSFGALQVKAVRGKVNPVIDDVDEEIELSLGSDLDFLKNDGNSLTLSDPQITINLTSTVPVPIIMDLSLSSMNSQGEFIAQDVAPDNGVIMLEPADPQTGARTTTIIIYKDFRPMGDPQDTLYVRMSNFSDLMTTIPDKILFNMHAEVDQSVEHYIDITQELSVSGAYKVDIPMGFENLYIEYSDTIADLGKDIKDVADKLDDAVIKLQAQVLSTLPLGVKLSAHAIDIDGKEIKDIKIDSCLITAGNEQGVKSIMKLGVNVTNGALAKLESIVFTATCQSSTEDGDVILKKGQYLELSDITLILPEGLKIDLTEDKKDKK